MREYRLKRHRLSRVFDDLPAEEFDALRDDIRRNGLIDPITLKDGKILDGWHRYLACLETDTKPRFTHYDGADDAAHVLSKNLYRRHLTTAQRAAAVVSCNEWAGAGKPSKSSAKMTNRKMAELARTSEKAIQQAKKASREGYLHELIEGRRPLFERPRPAPAENRNQADEILALRQENADLTEELSRVSAELRAYAMADAEVAGKARHTRKLMVEAEQMRGEIEMLRTRNRSLCDRLGISTEEEAYYGRILSIGKRA